MNLNHFSLISLPVLLFLILNISNVSSDPKAILEEFVKNSIAVSVLLSSRSNNPTVPQVISSPSKSNSLPPNLEYKEVYNIVVNRLCNSDALKQLGPCIKLISESDSLNDTLLDQLKILIPIHSFSIHEDQDVEFAKSFRQLVTKWYLIANRRILEDGKESFEMTFVKLYNLEKTFKEKMEYESAIKEADGFIYLKPFWLKMEILLRWSKLSSKVSGILNEFYKVTKDGSCFNLINKHFNDDKSIKDEKLLNFYPHKDPLLDLLWYLVDSNSYLKCFSPEPIKEKLYQVKKSEKDFFESLKNNDSSFTSAIKADFKIGDDPKLIEKYGLQIELSN